VLGILFSPRETFANVVQHPRWLGMLALVTLVMVTCTAALMSTESGQLAVVEQQVTAMENFGMEVSDEVYAQLQRSAGFAAYTSGATVLFVAPVMTLIVAGILFAVFTTLGGDASFRQIFAVVVHAGVVSAVQQIFVTPLNYARGSLSSPTNLSVFVPMLSETSFLARLLGTIDLFYIWWIVVLAIGLSVLYRRRTGSIAAGLFAVYGVIALAIAGAMSFFGRG
jgi:hypothetical protein